MSNLSDPVYAADMLLDWENEGIDALRRACGWDGEGAPPTVVILPDGKLATDGRIVTEDGPDE